MERLLCSLTGIVSARVITNPFGRLDEIHILAADTLHPKQVVRNVESALSAGLGIVIDRRVVSVAQVRLEDAGIGEAGFGFAGATSEVPHAAVAEPAPAPASPPPAAVREADPEGVSAPPVQLAENRYVFVGHDVRNDTNRETVCHVTVSRGGVHYTGSGRGSSSVAGRAQAAARGLFAALATARESEDLLFENAAVVDAHGRSYVLVSAHGLVGRRTEPLTGVAWVQRSPEEAAVLAGLQAVNRWTGDE